MSHDENKTSRSSYIREISTRTVSRSSGSKTSMSISRLRKKAKLQEEKRRAIESLSQMYDAKIADFDTMSQMS